jgi:hypothetical protein
MRRAKTFKDKAEHPRQTLRRPPRFDNDTFVPKGSLRDKGAKQFTSSKLTSSPRETSVDRFLTPLRNRNVIHLIALTFSDFRQEYGGQVVVFLLSII